MKKEKKKKEKRIEKRKRHHRKNKRNLIYIRKRLKFKEPSLIKHKLQRKSES